MPLVTFHPKTLRGQRRGRRVFLAVLTAISLGCGFWVWWLGRSAHAGQPHGIWLRFTPPVSTVAASVAFMALLAADYHTERVSTWAIALVAGVGEAPLTYRGLRESFGLSARPSMAVTGVIAAVFVIWLRLWVGKGKREQLRIPKRMGVGGRLDRFIEEAEREGNKITIARGLIERSTDLSRPDDLARASDLLRQAAEELPASDLLQLFGAASVLVEAMDAKYSRSGDLTGYAEAIDLLHAAVARLPQQREIDAIVAYHSAQFLLAQASVADVVAERMLLSDAVRQLQAARQAADAALLKEMAALHGMLALVGWRAGDMTDEDAIALCRQGQRLAGWSARRRAFSDVALASVLVERVEMDAPTARADVVRAVRLFRRAARRGLPGTRLEARAGLAKAVAHADALGVRHRPPDRIARIWQRAYRENLTGTSTGVIEVGNDWVDWAEAIGDPRLCAQAYRALMAAIPLAAGPRYGRGPKNRLLARVQARAEEAGWWMLRAGDPVGAIIALEHGRAVAMREITGRNDPAVEGALLDAGHIELAERYREAANALDLAERGAVRSDGFTSPLQRAAVDFDRLRRDIDALGLSGGTDLEHIRRATEEGPLLYLAAADSGGYAVVVRGWGAPSSVALPELSRGAVQAAVDDLESQDDAGRIERFAAWLWRAGMAEVDRHLGVGELVTIVAVGLLGLVPVHIAAVRDPAGALRWRGLADRNDFRYAPSASILRTTQARAAKLRGVPPSVVAVAAPGSAGEAELAYAVPEVTAVDAIWRDRARMCTLLPRATRASVLDQLPRHSVWHLACHGRAAPDRVLDSHVQLTDGPLTLRELLRLPTGVRRLAVLSSCESHRIGYELPDEVIGLPGGMLQLGVAGVVAAHWEVNDRAAAVLMARFHDLLAGQGWSPARALNGAQRWLRGATAAELRAAYPQLVGDRSTSFAHPFFWGAFTLTGT